MRASWERVALVVVLLVLAFYAGAHSIHGAGAPARSYQGSSSYSHRSYGSSGSGDVCHDGNFTNDPPRCKRARQR